MTANKSVYQLSVSSSDIDLLSYIRYLLETHGLDVTVKELGINE